MPSDNEIIMADGNLIDYDFIADEEFGKVKMMNPFIVKVKKLPKDEIVYYGWHMGAILARDDKGNFYATPFFGNGDYVGVTIFPKSIFNHNIQIVPPNTDPGRQVVQTDVSTPVQLGGRMTIQITYTYNTGETYSCNGFVGPNGEWYAQREDGSWAVSYNASASWEDAEELPGASLPPVTKGGTSTREEPQEQQN